MTHPVHHSRMESCLFKRPFVSPTETDGIIYAAAEFLLSNTSSQQLNEYAKSMRALPTLPGFCEFDILYPLVLTLVADEGRVIYRILRNTESIGLKASGDMRYDVAAAVDCSVRYIHYFLGAMGNLVINMPDGWTPTGFSIDIIVRGHCMEIGVAQWDEPDGHDRVGLLEEAVNWANKELLYGSIPDPMEERRERTERGAMAENSAPTYGAHHHSF